MLEALRQRLDLESAGYGRWRRRARRLCERQPGCTPEQAGGEDACDERLAAASAVTKPQGRRACHESLSFHIQERRYWRTAVHLPSAKEARSLPYARTPLPS